MPPSTSCDGPSPRLADQPAAGDPSTPTRSHFAPFDEHLNELAWTSRLQKDLDGHFANVFRRSVLSELCSLDDAVALAFQIIGRPTRFKIRRLARTVYMHWTCMQLRSKDTNVCARGIIDLVARMADRLGRMSIHAQRDFMDELNYLCVQRLKVLSRWHTDVAFRATLPTPRENLFMRVMAVVAMIGHLFRGGQFRYGTALNGLRYVAAMLPSPDAIAIAYALLHELGPDFAQEQAGWHFIQCLLSELCPLAANRIPTDPLYQLVSTFTALVVEWYETRIILYHAYPKVNDQPRARHSHR